MQSGDSFIHPTIIQGGMGVAVSNWRLARAVSESGQLGVVSGTGLDNILIRRLHNGDQHTRRALEHFPNQELAQAVLEEYPAVRGQRPYKLAPLAPTLQKNNTGLLSVLAAFVEVWLAKAGHTGVVGINLLTKIQMHILPTLYGALLADVDYVLMGAGIPRDIPEVLDSLCQGKTTHYKLEVSGALREESFRLEFDPTQIVEKPAFLKRPWFLPIVSSNVLATMLARKCGTGIAGFVVEMPTAGGHNAPPRGELQLDVLGQPIYSSKDEVNIEQLKALGYPFWLAGGTGSAQALQTALAQGATGIQVGTLFAYSRESGFAPEIKQAVLEQVQTSKVQVFTDPRASPTGFPFKVVQLPQTLSEATVFAQRNRVCDLGYLREPFRLESSEVGFRCAAEPVEAYLKKGGQLEATVGRKCLCNSLLASAGYPQQRGIKLEQALVTSGDELCQMGNFIEQYGTSYTASDVLQFLGLSAN